MALASESENDTQRFEKALAESIRKWENIRELNKILAQRCTLRNEIIKGCGFCHEYRNNAPSIKFCADCPCEDVAPGVVDGDGFCANVTHHFMMLTTKMIGGSTTGDARICFDESCARLLKILRNWKLGTPVKYNADDFPDARSSHNQERVNAISVNEEKKS